MSTRTRLSVVAVIVIVVLLMSAVPAFAKNKSRHAGLSAGKGHVVVKKGHTKGDFDGDGLKNIDEFRCGTNPRRADTDKDGITDSLEDPDKDGLTNGQEYLCGTNPRRADTDKDGILDGDEDVAAEPAPEVIGRMQADGTVATGDVSSVPESEAAIAIVDWYLAPEDRAGLMATGANFDYEVLIDAGTEFSWASSVNTDHEPSAADLTEGAAVTALDITYTADGELLAKKIVLIPSYLAGAAD